MHVDKKLTKLNFTVVLVGKSIALDEGDNLPFTRVSWPLLAPLLLSCVRKGQVHLLMKQSISLRIFCTL